MMKKGLNSKKRKIKGRTDYWCSQFRANNLASSGHIGGFKQNSYIIESPACYMFGLFNLNKLRTSYHRCKCWDPTKVCPSSVRSLRQCIVAVHHSIDLGVFYRFPTFCVLDKVYSSIGSADERLWKPDVKGQFSVK